ncbi:MAG TPA: hypothetical protein VF008_20835 [Niastella sp.]
MQQSLTIHDKSGHRINKVCNGTKRKVTASQMDGNIYRAGNNN